MPFGPYLPEKCEEQQAHLQTPKHRSHGFFISAQIRENTKTNKNRSKKKKTLVKCDLALHGL